MSELTETFDKAFRAYYLTPELIESVEEAKRFLVENPWVGEIAARRNMQLIAGMFEEGPSDYGEITNEV